MENLTEEQISKLQELKAKQYIKINIYQNVISANFNNHRYSLVLDNYQMKRFKEDFDSKTLNYDFTFWLRAIYVLGKCFKLEEEFPE